MARRNQNQSCLNCRSTSHLLVNCPYLCADCLDQNISHQHRIVCGTKHRYPFYQTIYDKQYVRLLGENQLSSLPDTIVPIREKFAEMLKVGPPALYQDNALVRGRGPDTGVLNGIFLTDDVGAYNVKSTIELLTHFHLAKAEHYWNKRLYEPKTKIFMRQIGSGHHEILFLEFTFPRNFVNADMEVQVLDLNEESRFSLRLATTDRHFMVSFISCSVNSDSIVLKTEPCHELRFDSNKRCLDYVSFSFDASSDEIKETILMLSFMSENVNRIASFEWIQNFIQDFHSRVEMIDLELPVKNSLDDMLREAVGVAGWCWEELDEEQQEAITELVKSQIYGIIGPPGTGKSQITSFAAFALVYLFGKKVLILTSRNLSADDTTQKLIKLLENYKTQGSLSENLHYNRFANQFNKFVTRRYPESRRGKQIDIPKGYFSYSGKVPENELEQKLQDFSIVVTTCGHGIHEGFDAFLPDTLIIDESSLLTPPDFLKIVGRQFFTFIRPEGSNIATGVTHRLSSSCTQLLLIGDPYQMLPRYSRTDIFDEKGNFDTGLTISPLMHYVRNGGIHTVLKHCRRGPDNLYNWPFEQFYPGQNIFADMMIDVGVKVSVPIDEDISKFKWFSEIFEKRGHLMPLQSIYINGPDDSMNRNGTSLENPQFRTISERLIRLLIKYGQVGIGGKQYIRIKQEHILLITPYKKQYKLLAEQLKRNGFEQVKVSTSDAIQGNESLIVIVDLVRSDDTPGFMAGRTAQHFGFAQNGRMNVTFTRARAARFTIGNVTKLQNSHPNSDINQFAQHHLNNPNQQVVAFEIKSTF